jgi:hypothetical protein
MTKHKKLPLFILAVIGLFMLADKSQDVVETKKVTHKPAVTVIPAPKVIQHDKKPVARVPASVGYINTPSADWKERLETSLRAQSGDSLKSIKIQKENSMVWMKDGNPIHVESVIITLTSQQAAESSFRAMVDSQTGKVLESWDRTISDPANVRGGFRIKLDPRYSN